MGIVGQTVSHTESGTGRRHARRDRRSHRHRTATLYLRRHLGRPVYRRHLRTSHRIRPAQRDDPQIERTRGGGRSRETIENLPTDHGEFARR